MSEASYRQTYSPRDPKPDEVAAIERYYQRTLNLSPEELDLASARIAVLTNYITDCPGYAGPLFLVVWSGGPEIHDLLCRASDGELFRQPSHQEMYPTPGSVRTYRIQSQPRTVKRITVPDHEVPDSLLMLGENDNGIFYLDADTPRVYFRSCQGQWTLTVVAKADVSDVAAEYVQDFGEQGSDYTKDRLLDYIARLEGGLL
jgi:hypothetical protein